MTSSTFQMNRLSFKILFFFVSMISCAEKSPIDQKEKELMNRLGIPAGRGVTYLDLDACPTCTQYNKPLKDSILKTGKCLVVFTKSKKKFHVFQGEIDLETCIFWDSLGYGKKLKVVTNKSILPGER